MSPDFPPTQESLGPAMISVARRLGLKLRYQGTTAWFEIPAAGERAAALCGVESASVRRRGGLQTSASSPVASIPGLRAPCSDRRLMLASDEKGEGQPARPYG